MNQAAVTMEGFDLGAEWERNMIVRYIMHRAITAAPGSTKDELMFILDWLTSRKPGEPV